MNKRTTKIAIKHQLKAIDITPDWGLAMDIIIAALDNGTKTGKDLARQELRDLAVKLDEMNRAQRIKQGAKHALAQGMKDNARVNK